MSTRSKKKKRDGRAQDQGLDNRVRRPVVVATVVLFVVTVATVGILAWPLIKPAPAITRPANMEALPDELQIFIDEHVKLVRANPRDARVRATLGLVYEANDLWPEARLSYMNATSLQKDEPMWPHHAAIAWLKTGDIKGAIEWMQTHASRFPTFAPMQHRLGIALLEAGKGETARAAFQRVIESQPRSPAGYVGLGDVRLQAGNADGAAKALEKAISLDPNDKKARYLLGRAYRAMGRLEEAERELTLGARAQTMVLPDVWSVQRTKYEVGVTGKKNRAATLLKEGKPAQAAAILERVRAAQPGDLDVLVNLGIAYLDAKEFDKAESVLLKAEEMDQSRFETYINLAACYRRMRRLPDALVYAERAVALSPKASQAHVTHGMILKQMQQYESALVALEAANRLKAGNPIVAQELANVCSRLGRLDEAILHFQTLARLLPNRWEPHLGIARAYFQKGQLDEAHGAVRVGLGIAPNEPSLKALAESIAGARND